MSSSLRRAVVRLASLCVATVTLGACDAASERPRNTLLIGADGLEWSVALPLVREGAMPELAALMQRGAFGYLETALPTVSPLIWTSIATGKHHRKHGVQGFRTTDEVDGRTRITRSWNGRTKAFWNILSDYDRRVHVVGWWLTYPVEAINGVMVAQTNTASRKSVRSGHAIHKGRLYEGVPGQVHPGAREEEMLDVLRESQVALPTQVDRIFGPGLRDVSPVAERWWAASEWAFRADATYAEIGRRLAADEETPDLLAIYIGGTDVVGHRFWRYHEPAAYLHPPTPDELRVVGSIYDVVPTILALLGIPVGDDMDGVVLEELLVPGALGAGGVERVASHDTPAWQRERLGVRRSEADDSERIQQLRELGYIE